ncbi:casein kinase I [Enterospora canceri]|uniref:non-specific serine/threonine protein kinase n=1 Tax=Enterospora canceri TaxID=1081671 RepID=A0A1Y1S7I7_9MICR|nr:casein kinase I [Enterospora canceri]
MQNMRHRPKGIVSSHPTEMRNNSTKADSGELDGNRYTVVEKLGEGSFGVVYKIQDRNDDEFYAMKVPRETEKDKTKKCRKAVEYLNAEIEALESIRRHHGIIRAVSYEKNEYLMMELGGGSCLDLMRRSRKVVTQGIFRVFEMVLDALEHIHSSGYVYRDIKPENILLNSCNQNSITNLKLVDFGSAIKISAILNNSVVGTLRYCSINCHRAKAPCFLDDLENLVYVCIWMYEGKLPWEEKYLKIVESSVMEESRVEDVEEHNKQVVGSSRAADSQHKSSTNMRVCQTKMKYMEEVINGSKTSLTKDRKLHELYKFISSCQMRRRNLLKIVEIPTVYNPRIYERMREIIRSKEKKTISQSIYSLFCGCCVI